MFVGLVSYLVFLLYQARRGDQNSGSQQPSQEVLEDSNKGASQLQNPSFFKQSIGSVSLVLIGLILLVFGSQALVTASVSFAKLLGVSDLVIGLKVVAAGTSLPELAASFVAAIKGERDMAVGNLIGRSIFNILGCLGLSGLVASGGLPIPNKVLVFDQWVMLAAFLACAPAFITGREIARWEGGILLFYYFVHTC